MGRELTAQTEAGGRLVALAETLAREIAPHAAAHDRDASFPFDSLAAVKASRFLTAPIPEELGGLGVTSTHDVVVASSRLARGDAAHARREHAPRLRPERGAALGEGSRRG